MTDLGKLLVELPIDPQFGKMVLIGMTLKCLDPAIIIACCSSFKEPCMLFRNGLVTILLFIVRSYYKFFS